MIFGPCNLLQIVAEAARENRWNRKDLVGNEHRLHGHVFMIRKPPMENYLLFWFQTPIRFMDPGVILGCG